MATLSVLDAGISRLPARHFVADEVLDRARQFLERGRGGAAAARACRNQRHEGAEAHGLQQFLRDLHLDRAIAAGLGRQRNPDGIADAVLQENAERGGRGHDALRSHAGFGEAEMDRVIRARRQNLVDRDQILHGGHFRRQDHAVLGHAEFFGARRRQQRRLHHRLARHRARIERLGQFGVVFHQPGEQFLIERAPIGADPHRLVVLVRDLDDVGELGVALVLEADIAGIDAVFVERLGAGRMLGQQLVADIMEIADQGRGDAALARPSRICGTAAAASSRSTVIRTSSEPARESAATCATVPVDIGGVGIGHRLHHDRRAPADGDIADHDLRGFVPGPRAGDVVLRRCFRLVHGVSNIRFW